MYKEYWVAEPGSPFVAQYIRGEGDEWRVQIWDDPDEVVDSLHFNVEVALQSLCALVLDE